MNNNLSDENQKKWAEIKAKCWSDEAFKKHFKENPLDVLKAYGMKWPSNHTCKVIEDTKDTLYLPLRLESEKGTNEHN